MRKPTAEEYQRRNKYGKLLKDAYSFACGYYELPKVAGVNASSVKWLYSALVLYCNNNYWRQPFKITDRELAIITNIDRRTLPKARKVLADYGKIYYEESMLGVIYAFDKNVNLSPLNQAEEAGAKNSMDSATLRMDSATTLQALSMDSATLRMDSATLRMDSATTLQPDTMDAPLFTPLGESQTLTTTASVKIENPPCFSKQNKINQSKEKKEKQKKTKINQSINPALQKNEINNEPKNKAFNPSYGEHHNKNVIQGETEEASKEGLIDGFSVGERKNLGGAGQFDFSETNTHPTHTTAKPTPKIEAGSMLDKLIAEYGVDTVNQAKWQIEQHQERTGRTDLLTRYNYWVTTCQRILGMTDVKGKLKKKDRHQANSSEGKGGQSANFGDFLPMPHSEKCYAEVTEILEQNDPDLINKRYRICMDEFDKHYDSVVETPAEEMLKILHPILKEYQARGMTDKEYNAKKKASGKW